MWTTQRLSNERCITVKGRGYRALFLFSKYEGDISVLSFSLCPLGKSKRIPYVTP